ncbi:hypothetical protein EYC80_005459 [Monilinia laxa]|uniref:Uncharacterized protein n=1 Tax=Monilinia laxa TaxID=61186 RepID=A0A5N6KDY2_MONLA|nr:hypothetical protein EYC80_005459 [Monilinia laxa]
MTPISPNHQPRGLTLPPITTLLALTITGITLLTLLTISLTLLYQRHTLLYQRHTLHLRRAREETLGRVAISNSQTGPIHGDPRESARATEPARDERDARAESTVEVNGGIWPPKDAERVEGNSGEAGGRNGTGEMVDARSGVGRGVKESRDVRVQVVEEEKEDRGKTSLT